MKQAIVTGASSGIGAAVVRQLLEDATPATATFYAASGQ